MGGAPEAPGAPELGAWRDAVAAAAAEREADLARVEAQVKSLRQVEAEQQNIIDKLAVGEAYGRVPVEGTEEGF